jgi:hypothetical protein
MHRMIQITFGLVVLAAMLTPTACGGPTLGKTYTAPDGFFAMSYPASWHAGQSGVWLVFVENEEMLSPDAGATGPGMVILGGKGALRGSLQEALQKWLDQMKKNIKDLQATEIQPRTIGGQSGVSAFVTATDTKHNIKYKSYLVMVASADGGLFITTTSPQEAWDKNWPTFEAILSSIRFNVATPTPRPTRTPTPTP